MANDDREARAREGVRRTLRNLPWLFSKDWEGIRQIFRRWLVKEDLAVWVRFAKEGDADAIDLLRDYARRARRAGGAVPTELHEFVWEWFIDGPPKAPSGSSLKDTAVRDVCIATLVRFVHENFGFPEYSNSEWRGEKDGPMTACRLVAEEISLSERTVERIWGKRKADVVHPAKFGG